MPNVVTAGWSARATGQGAVRRGPGPAHPRVRSEGAAGPGVHLGRDHGGAGYPRHDRGRAVCRGRGHPGPVADPVAGRPGSRHRAPDPSARARRPAAGGGRAGSDLDGGGSRGAGRCADPGPAEIPVVHLRPRLPGLRPVDQGRCPGLAVRAAGALRGNADRRPACGVRQVRTALVARRPETARPQAVGADDRRGRPAPCGDDGYRGRHRRGHRPRRRCDDVHGAVRLPGDLRARQLRPGHLYRPRRAQAPDARPGGHGCPFRGQLIPDSGQPPSADMGRACAGNHDGLLRFR
jgi:hypothetical protein